MIRHVSLRIDAVYLDSFLYSGALFLLDMDGRLTSYDWQRIVSLALAAHGREDLTALFIDSRKPTALTETDEGLELEVAAGIIRDAETSSIAWNVWPTDLNIYSNNIYISDESGAYAASFDYASKSIDPESVQNIKRGYIYAMAPGDGGRLAIASPNSGLSVLIFNEQERPLVEDDIFDCDWFGTSLVANSREHSYLTKFPPLPKRDSFEDVQDFYASLRHAKNAEPTTEKLDVAGQSEYHWLAGQDAIEEAPQGEAPVPGRSRIIRARSASFGSIIEHVDQLIIRRTDSRQTIDIQKPVFWRTFSRSKSYLNQLHVCSGEGMQIRAYDTARRDGDRFAVELSDFDI
jgi:hypothetical protein